MAQGNTAVTPLLTHWSYCSLALNHRYYVLCLIKQCLTGGQNKLTLNTSSANLESGHRWIPIIHISHAWLNAFFDVSLNKWLNKHIRCRSFQTLWRSWGCHNEREKSFRFRLCPLTTQYCFIGHAQTSLVTTAGCQHLLCQHHNKFR